MARMHSDGHVRGTHGAWASPICQLLALTLIFWTLGACGTGSGVSSGGDEDISGDDVSEDVSGSVDAVGGDSGGDEDDAGGDPTPDVIEDASTGGGTEDVVPDTIEEDVEDPNQGTFECTDDTSGGAGCPCTDNSDCFSGFCVQGPEGLMCTKTCETDCPAGFSCSAVSGDGDTSYICVYDHMQYCSPCDKNADCFPLGLEQSPNRCVEGTEGAGSFCVTTCNGDSDCPSGAACSALADDDSGLTYCQPTADQCDCSQVAIDFAASTECAVSNEFGSCLGIRECTEDGLTDCDAPEPAQEQCNGADDNCDGNIDEGAGGDACEVTSGDWTCEGVWVCANSELACDAPEPKAEECNGVDDNCDGFTDEGFPNSDNDNIANCVDTDDDDDGVLDDGNGDGESGTFPCSPESGVTEGCDDNCPETPNADQGDKDGDKIGDVCDDDADNDGFNKELDCDDLDSTVGCESFYFDGDHDGVADCDVKLCLCEAEGDYAYETCEIDDCDDTKDTVGPGFEEICDDLDNDCDGFTDEGTPDTDGDGEGDACDLDDDDDAILDVDDNCPLVENNDQLDTDGDQAGDACDDDDDDDSWDDVDDCEPLNAEIHPEAGELCNDLDDDCDDEIDEFFPTLGDVCDGDDVDAWEGGLFVCDAEGFDVVCDDPELASPEVCDGVDNDEDGFVDEGLADAGAECSSPLNTCEFGFIACDPQGAPTCLAPAPPDLPELCNGADDNCNGIADEDFPELGQACDGDDDDECALGVWVCSADGGVECSESPDDLQVEACNDIDDDCDGATDETFLTLGDACDGGDEDACDDGAFACNEAGDGVVCDDPEGFVTEACNNIDDDCDGFTDEDFEALGTPCDGGDDDLCENGLLICNDDGLTLVCDEVISDLVETCNDIDDDCDGATDEDWPGKGAPCDGGDSDECENGVLECGDDEDSLVCGAEVVSDIVESCATALDDDCDGETNEGCTPASVNVTFHSVVVPLGSTTGGASFSLGAAAGESVIGPAGAAPGGTYNVQFGVYPVILHGQ